MTTSPLQSDSATEPHPRARRISIFGRELPLPRSRLLRVLLGIVLVVFGIFGFLPILGFWMVPLGLIVLSHDISAVRRFRRRVDVRVLRWWQLRRSRATTG